MTNLFRYWIPWLSAACVLLYLATRSAHDLPELYFWGADKLFHFAYFFGLGLLSARLFFAWIGKKPEKKRQAQLAAILATLVFGLIDESLQSFSSGREVDFFDLVADLAGGGLAAWIFPRYRAFAVRWEAKLARQFGNR